MSVQTAVILAAGYGNRIRDFDRLTEEERRAYSGYLETHRELLLSTPKPLLPVWGHPIVTLLVKKIEAETEIQNVYVVTNSDYYSQFERWREGLATGLEIRVIDNGVRTSGQGWVKDFYKVVTREHLDEDILLLAGDTIFDFSLKDLISYADDKGTDVLAVYRAPKKDLHRRGIVVLDAQDRVREYLEKPQHPPSDLAGIITYVLRRETLHLLPQAVGEGYRQELNLMEWLSQNKLREVFAFHFKNRLDIGTAPDLCEADKLSPWKGWRF